MRQALPVILVGTCSMLVHSAALAQPDYGLDFVTVGAAGNRATNPGEVPYQPDLKIGAVPYDYRIMRSELTVQQYCEFVRAYAPYYPDARYDSFFTGIWIGANYDSDTGPVTFVYNPAVANFPTTLTWRFAARYCNWLQNGKALNQAAFENGAYDTSTFGQRADGSITDQVTRSPGAKYWIPSLDEWTKAAYYDPKKGGVGGYWRYPNSTNTALTAGPPGVGQTSAGTWPGDSFGWFDAGSYPDSKSPWGVLDLSGGTREWMEDIAGDAHRYVRGSYRYSQVPDLDDRLDFVEYGTHPWIDAWNGVRLASSVPPPASTFVALVVLAPRRKRT